MPRTRGVRVEILKEQVVQEEAREGGSRDRKVGVGSRATLCGEQDQRWQDPGGGMSRFCHAPWSWKRWDQNRYHSRNVGITD